MTTSNTFTYPHSHWTSCEFYKRLLLNKGTKEGMKVRKRGVKDVDGNGT